MAGNVTLVRQLEGDRFAVRIRDHEIEVDQPVGSGGTDAAPTPSELFVASIAACAAFYVGRFLRRHAVRGPWILRSVHHWNEERHSYIDRVDITLVLPAGVGEDVRAGAIRAADRCTVRQSMRWGIDVAITATTHEAVLA